MTNQDCDKRKYTLAEGVVICEAIEFSLKEAGYHVALGGSALYRGWSTKDIDIMIYPHSSHASCHRQFLVAKLEALGFIPSKSIETTNIAEVHKTTKDGVPVDFFFLNRE